MLTAALYIAFFSIAAAVAICMVRLVRGPHTPDRVLAFDTLYINTIALMIVLAGLLPVIVLSRGITRSRPGHDQR